MDLKDRSCMKNFYNHKRHYFIMTLTGKPLFSKYGDQIELSSFFAGLSVIIQKYCQFFSNSNDDKLETLIFPDQKIFFWHKQQLIFICISKIEGESEFLIRKALEFMDLQILSMITDQIYKRLESRPNFDPSHLIQGSEKQIIGSLKYGTNNYSIFMDSYPCFNLNKHSRDKISEVFKQNQTLEPLYQVLMTQQSIITYYKSKKIKGSYQDFQILLNWMQTQPQLQKEQNWVPISLPGISTEGYVYAYINFIADNIGLIIISDDNSKDTFYSFTQQAQSIQQQLNDFGLIQQIQENLEKDQLQENFQIPYVKQILIKNLQNNQIFFNQKQEFKASFDTKDIIRKFANIYNQFQLLNQNKKEYLSYDKDLNQGICLYANSEYCIIFSVGSFIKIDDLNEIIFNILKKIKDDLVNYFFN